MYCNLKKIKNGLFFLLIFSGIFLSSKLFVLAKNDCSIISDETDRKKCEDGLDKKDEYKNKIQAVTKELQATKENLSVVQKSLLSTQQALNQTKKEIEDKVSEIERQDKQIELLNQKNDLYQKALSSALRDFYYSQQNKPDFFLVLENDKKSGFLADSNNLSIFQGEVLDLVKEINDTKSLIQAKKDEVEKAKEDKEDLLALKEDQQQSLISEKKQTQNELYTKEATIAELNAKLTKLDADISNLLGGSIKEGDIAGAAEFASKKTGVRKNFILGMLVVETDLGRFTGGCTYAQVEKVSVEKYKKYGSKYKDSIALLYKRRDLFYNLVDDLGYNKNKKVSCSPSGYIGQGGAMGVSQFMSDVWMGYSPRIKAKTGKSKTDPWSLTDGVMAMALKLANDGALNGESGECNAAKRYLGGNHQWYCDKVLYWAKNYKDKL